MGYFCKQTLCFISIKSMSLRNLFLVMSVIVNYDWIANHHNSPQNLNFFNKNLFTIPFETNHQYSHGHELEQTLGDDEGQGGLVCCSPWGHKELDTTRWLNWTEDNILWKVSTRDLPKGILNRNVVQLLSHVWLFAIPWTAACQASLSFTVPGVCSNSCPLSWWCHPTNRNVRKLFRF